MREKVHPFVCFKSSDPLTGTLFFFLWEKHNILTNCYFFVLFKIVQASLPSSCIFRPEYPDGVSPLLCSKQHIRSIGRCVTASPPMSCSAPEAQKRHMLEPSSRVGLQRVRRLYINSMLENMVYLGLPRKFLFFIFHLLYF